MFKTKKIEKKEILIFVISLILLCSITFSGRFLKLINSIPLRLAANCMIYLLMFSVVYLAMRSTKRLSVLKIEKENLLSQIMLGLYGAVILAFFIGYLPTLFEFSFIGQKMQVESGQLIFYGIFNIFFVGFIEEIIFRGYLQEQLQNWLGNKKFLAPLISGMLFGLWHLINGNLWQMLFAFGLGCIWGYSKHFFKKCSLLTVCISHGVYDFLLIIIRVFLMN